MDQPRRAHFRLRRVTAQCLANPCSQSSTTSISSAAWIGPFPGGGVIDGFTEPGFEAVRSAFEKNFALKMELGSQLVVYHKGKKVVDLSGRSPGAPNYDADTLQVVFSSGKNMEGIAMAMLVDRGLVSYDDRVTKHWPEFGKHGKEAITIADVMRHEGGCPMFAAPGAEDDSSKDVKLKPSDVREIEPMERIIENAAKMPHSGGPRCYHAETRGYLVNGIIRRVDPQKRSIGRFILQEISQPLGLTYFCGIPESEQSKYKYAPMTQMPLWYNLSFEVLPAMLGLPSHAQLKAGIDTFSDKTNLMLRGAVDWRGEPASPAFNNSAEGRAMETTSAGMYGNARSVAKVNALMAGRGEVDGVRLMSEEAWRASMSEFKVGLDQGLQMTFAFSQGGFCDFSSYEGQLLHPDDLPSMAGCHGWGGWGGSISVWDPARDVSIVYIPNAMSNYMLGGPRSREILLTIQKCLADLGAKL